MMRHLLGPTTWSLFQLVLTNGAPSLSEITIHVGLSKTAVLKHMNKLVRLGLVEKVFVLTDTGRHSRYSVKRCDVLFSVDPDSGTVLEVTGQDDDDLLIEQVNQSEFRNDIKKIQFSGDYLVILYGSVSRGHGTPRSDIDILFVKPKWNKSSKNEVEDMISEANLHSDHPIRHIFVTVEEFLKGSELLEEIYIEGMIIYGERHSSPMVWGKMERYRNIKD